jgi:uncharacterized protein YjhX (UPF0386 family)
MLHAGERLVFLVDGGRLVPDDGYGGRRSFAVEQSAEIEEMRCLSRSGDSAKG